MPSACRHGRGAGQGHPESWALSFNPGFITHGLYDLEQAAHLCGPCVLISKWTGSVTTRNCLERELFPPPQLLGVPSWSPLLSRQAAPGTVRLLPSKNEDTTLSAGTLLF